MADAYSNVTSPSKTDLFISKRSKRQKLKRDIKENRKFAWKLYMRRIGAMTDATDTAYIDKNGELVPVQTWDEFQKTGKYWEPPSKPKKVKHRTAQEQQALEQLRLKTNQRQNTLEAEQQVDQIENGQTPQMPQMTDDYKTDEAALVEYAEKSTPTKDTLKINGSTVFTKAAFDFAGVKKGQSLGVLTRNQRRMYDKLVAGG